MDRKKDEVAWAAGLYEGEGFVGHGNKGNSTIQLIINMTDLEPLLEFQRITGVGKVSDPRPMTFNGKPVKDQYRYAVHNFEHVQYIIAILWNYLSPRRKAQAKEVLTTMKHHYANSHVRRTYGKRVSQLSSDERRAYERWKTSRRTRTISPPR